MTSNFDIKDVKVSVIVPVCNVEKYLSQCLDSILCQTHKNLQIIILNDGSKDNSLSIIKKYAEEDNRIVVIDKENEGYGKTCNRGLDLAEGDYISVIEPDDWIEPKMYEEMLEKAFQENFVIFDKSNKAESVIDIVKTPWIEVRNWDDDQKCYECPSVMFMTIKDTLKPCTLHDKPELIQTHPSIWSAIYRTDFIKENNIRFPEYPGAGWADNPFLISTMYQAQNIIYFNRLFYHYRTDLFGSTRNHKNDYLKALPFNRWIDMTNLLKQFNCNDKQIWQAHYVRGFGYVQGAIVDDGWDTPIIREKAKEVFNMMDPKLIADHPNIHPELKALYKEVTGVDLPAHRLKNFTNRVMSIAKGDYYLFKTFGLKSVLLRDKDRVKRKLTRLADKRTVMQDIEKAHDESVKQAKIVNERDIEVNKNGNKAMNKYKF